MVQTNIKSANWHFTSKCNYSCKFCSRQNCTSDLMSLKSVDNILTHLKNLGIEKLNLVGGEPMMHSLFYDLIRLAYEKDFVVCVTTNGSFLNKNTIQKMQPYVSWIGISIDSVSDITAAEMGRGNGRHLAHIKEIVQFIHEAGIKLKINTVVTKQTKDEDMRDVIAELSPSRWKVFQFLTIVGQNDKISSEFSISSKEFDEYCDRHRLIKLGNGTEKIFSPVFESAECMADSYFMVDADGLVEINTPRGVIHISLEAVTNNNIEEMLNLKNYMERGAVYEW